MASCLNSVTFGRMRAVVVLSLMLIAFTTGCRTASRAVDNPVHSAASLAHPSSLANTNSIEGRWHTVKVTPKPKDISTWNKLNPIWWYGNIDDPTPPAWFRPGEKRRVAKWRGRNPFHNFTFYVIGIADKPHYRSGRYPRNVGNPNGGWNFALVRRKLVVLPFIAYNRGKFDSYFGWRPAGNFGAKINYNAKRPPKTQRPAAAPVVTSPPDNMTAPDSPP